MTDTVSAARALAEWALANPAEAARLWRMAQRRPGGMCNAYLPPLPSLEAETVAQVRRIMGLETPLSRAMRDRYGVRKGSTEPA